MASHVMKTTETGPEAHVATRSSVSGLSPYRQGQSTAGGFRNPIKLSSNESPLGPSPLAIKAFNEAGARLFRYPDGAQTGLRNAIGDVFSLDPEKIVCGNGSEELQLLLVRAFLAPGDEVVWSEHAFVMGRIHAEAHGCKVVVAKEPGHRADADEILKAITPATKMIMLASPNNPVGDYIRRRDLHRLIEAAPKDILILYDGAYADYVDEPDYDDGLSLVDDHPNVVVTRTFSKLYGLAGLRVGWMYADKAVIEAIQKIRTPFNVNIAALAAAEAAVRDRDYAALVKAHNRKALPRICEKIEALGFRVFPSVANFYLIEFPPDGPHTAANAYEFMVARGVIPRPVNAGGPAGCLRITVGLDHENEAAVSALAEFSRSS